MNQVLPRSKDDKTTGRRDLIESDVYFKMWIRKRRMFAAMTVEELETFALTGQWPDRPEPTLGTSRLDSMDGARLIKLSKERSGNVRGRRNSEELEFFANHGHRPEQTQG